MLTVGSLFSGIGGLELGLERAGMRVEWQVENDSFCTKVLEKHWPHVTRHGDIRTAGRHNLSRVDVLAGGFPCQPHSVAGKRKASNDERNLWPEFYRIVCELWCPSHPRKGILIGLPRQNRTAARSAKKSRQSDRWQPCGVDEERAVRRWGEL